MQRANNEVDRTRWALLSATSGAGILGLGLGALTAPYLGSLGWPLLAAGVALHAWGMTDKHRVESRGRATLPDAM